MYCVANVHVTSTSTFVMPLEKMKRNRILRHKDFSDINKLCLVYLKPDTNAKYVKKCQNFQIVFESGIKICNNWYYLFGASNSQLGEYNYWFIQAISLEEAHQKRRILGNFSNIANVGKYVARLGQWFSTTYPTRVINLTTLLMRFL